MIGDLTATERAFPTTIFVTASRTVRQLFIECSTFFSLNQLRFTFQKASRVDTFIPVVSMAFSAIHTKVADFVCVWGGKGSCLCSGIGYIITHEPGLVGILPVSKNRRGRTGIFSLINDFPLALEASLFLHDQGKSTQNYWIPHFKALQKQRGFYSDWRLLQTKLQSGLPLYIVPNSYASSKETL